MTVDDRAWQAATDQWVIQARREGKKASTEVAYAIMTRARELLGWYPHPYRTQTPSPAHIGPVGRIVGSGDRHVTPGWLRESPRTTQRYEGYDVAVGPTARYSRIQELGGIANNNAHLPPRPYWKYAHETVVKGSRGDIYRRHWLAAQKAVTHT